MSARSDGQKRDKSETRSTDRIEKVVELKAPVARVWRAVTDHVEFGTWFRVALDGPFRVGELSTGQITYPGYEHVRWEAIVERMEPQRLFVFSWPCHEAGVDDDVPKIQVTFELEATDGGTRLTITESGFDAVPNPKRLELLRQNTEGWDIQARHIAAHVEP